MSSIHPIFAAALKPFAPPPPVYTCRDCGEVEVRTQHAQCRACFRLFDSAKAVQS